MWYDLAMETMYFYLSAILTLIMLFTGICAYCLSVALLRNSHESEPQTKFLSRIAISMQTLVKALMWIVAIWVVAAAVTAALSYWVPMDGESEVTTEQSPA